MEGNGQSPEQLPKPISIDHFKSKTTVSYEKPVRSATVTPLRPEGEDATVDPVEAFFTDPPTDATVTFTTPDQFQSVRRFVTNDASLLNLENFTLAPQNTDDLLSMLSVFGETDTDRYTEPTPEAIAMRQAIVEHVDASLLTQHELTLQQDDTKILTQVVMGDLPELKTVVLEAISSMDIPSNADPQQKLEWNRYISNSLRALITLDENHPDYTHRAYIKSLLEKVTKTPENMKEIFEQAYNVYRPPYEEEPGEEERLEALTFVLESSFPELPEQIIRNYREASVPLPSDMSITDLLKSYPHMENYKMVLHSAIRYAKELGGIDIVRPQDMVTLLGTVRQISGEPDYVPTDEELDTLKRLGVDPTNIPDALLDAETLDAAIRNLYSAGLTN